MKNYIQRGDDLTLAAPYNVSSGDGCLVGTIFGVAAIDAESGDDVDISTRGVFSLPKAGVAITLGARMYWDDTAKVVTTDDDDGDNLLIGAAVAAAADVASTIAVRLNGTVPALVPAPAP